MKTLIKIAECFVLSVIIAGCTDSSYINGDTGDVKNTPDMTAERVKYSKLPDDAVLISVNGEELTKGRFKKWVALRKVMAKRDLNKINQSEDDKLDIVELQMLRSVTNDFIRQTLACEYAKKNGIEASSNRVAACKAGFSKLAGIPNRRWQKVVEYFSDDLRETVEDRVSVEALTGTVFDYIVEKRNMSLDDAELNKLYSSYLAYNRECAVTNSFVWAKASNIWNRVEAGERFEDLSIQYDEDETRADDGVWGTFQTGDFTDEPAITRLSSKFRVGWVSPPIEADNGLMILRVNSIKDDGLDVTAPDYSPSPNAEITLSRIFFHLPMFIEEIERDEFAKECIKAKKLAEFEYFLTDLITKAKIEFPCGTKIFDTEERKLNFGTGM